MKIKYIFFYLLLWSGMAWSQDVIPKAKSWKERMAGKSLEEKIESVAPIDISLPKNPIKTKDGETVNSIEEAKKYLKEQMPDYDVKGSIKKAKKLVEKKTENEVFDGKSYYKIPVEKEVYKRGSGSRLQYIEFYVLNDENVKPSKYNRMLTWYDEKNERIVDAVTRDKSTNRILHGPFKEYRGETLVKEGYYYLGAKDGRWVEYDKDFILLDKKYYKRGFLADSKITYYEGDSTKIEEVIPFAYGKQTGPYYKFYPEGTLAEEGNYENGKKVGLWISYYSNGNRRMKETQYPADEYTEGEPVLIREYSADGKLLYENPDFRRN